MLAATQISAGTFVGTLGRHYLTGVSFMWIWFGLWTGWIISAVFVAPKLRRFGALTVADYVGKRFASEGARTLSAGLIILTYTVYLTAQFQAAGEIASAIFGVPPLSAMLLLLKSCRNLKCSSTPVGWSGTSRIGATRCVEPSSAAPSRQRSRGSLVSVGDPGGFSQGEPAS